MTFGIIDMEAGVGFRLKYDKAFMAASDRAEVKDLPFPTTPFTFGASSGKGPMRVVWRVLAPVLSIIKTLGWALFGLIVRFARTWYPYPRICRLVLVTNQEGARAVLSDGETFAVPYTPEMIELAGGTNSVLGMKGAEHEAISRLIQLAMAGLDPQKIVAGTVTLDDIPRDANNTPIDSMTERIAEQCFATANALLDNSGGRIDVMTDLVTRTLTETTCSYFGLTVAQPEEFARWTMAVSRLLFGDPAGSATTRTEALNAAPRINRVIDRAIAAARHDNAPDGLIAVLVAIQQAQLALPPEQLLASSQIVMTDERIRATVIGLIVALIPTNTLAAGKMLGELLRRKHGTHWTRAIDIAVAGKDAAAKPAMDEAMADLLLEAGRLRPALAPGLWRYVTRDGQIGTGRHARRVKPDQVVLVVIPSVLRDRLERPHDFDAARRQYPEFMFGHGPHLCVGRRLAITQITQIFMALLARKPVPARKHGKAEFVGPFPVRLDMDFSPHVVAAERPSSTMILIAAPATGSVAHTTTQTTFRAVREEIERAIADLGNPAGDRVRESLDATGLVHFASLSVVKANEAETKPPVILFEINADGPRDMVLRAIAERATGWLGPVFAFVDQTVRSDDQQLFRVLAAHARDLRCSPFGTTGLHFDGMRQFSVRDIGRHQTLAAFAREKLDEHLRRSLGRKGRAGDAIAAVRTSVRADPDLRGDIMKPSRQLLDIARWRAPRSLVGPFFTKVLRTPSVVQIQVLILVVGVGLFATLWWIAAGLRQGLPSSSWPGDAFTFIWMVFWVTLGSVLATLGIIVILVAVFAVQLAYHEKQDEADDRQTDLGHIERLAAIEDAPGQAQNHILAVMPLKRPIWFRRCTLALALWGIKQSLMWFRPGFVKSMGTIHYAKWFVVPGTNQFVFLSNYDGSWESYLEDFITRANEGQSAAWSNGLGFPMTRWLIRYGAEDGDRFKRWVRRQQQPTPCWYSRFPDLTAEQIRKNALVQDGLARATTSTEARAWLSAFGSEQRQEGEIEADEVQSLVFSGQPHSQFTTCLSIRVPLEAVSRKKWLDVLTGQTIGAKQHAARDWHEKFTGSANLRIGFGDHSSPRGATFLAFSAAGLAKMGLPDGSETHGKAGLASFPPAFRIGMAKRARILGDATDVSHDDAYTWHDGEGDRQVNAVLLVYGPPPADGPDDAGDIPGTRSREQILKARELHRAAVGEHVAFLTHCGGEVVASTSTGPDDVADDTAVGLLEHGVGEREPFGFRDGISQPVIRGTRQAAKRPLSRDMVAPGEFLLGYRNHQDYFPPALTVLASDDPLDELPTIAANTPQRFPFFGSYDAASEDGDSLDPFAQSTYRDFGRNGTFLVIRDLEQDVAGFADFTSAQAARVNVDYPHLSDVLGRKVDAAWVAAKMVGRWQNGSPLVGNGDRPGTVGPAASPDNDFSYGCDDPRGLQCPLGAHTRRCNPRDSLQPGDPEELLITNRHRLLRRGRSYAYRAAAAEPVAGSHAVAASPTRYGLLFACLCADLDRQFEFVQQSWIGSPSFHGLSDEPDPMLARVGAPTGRSSAGSAQPGTPARRVFTIPTIGGAVTLHGMKTYVTVRAGGYFFLPSRSAIRFLSTLGV